MKNGKKYPVIIESMRLTDCDRLEVIGRIETVIIESKQNHKDLYNHGEKD